jgi:hypothetical protein
MQASALPCGAALFPRRKSRPRVAGELRERSGNGCGALGLKDIEAAVKKVKRAGPLNQWKETAWHLSWKGEI